MAKRIILLLSCVFCLQFVVAQSMTDEQIMQYISQEQEKGTDQQTIATKLLQKGVTFERLNRIKKKTRAASKANAAGSATSRSREGGNSVLYFDEYLLMEPRVFGHNIFNNELLTFEPSNNIPTPSDYILGAGDYVFIDVWGASQNLIETEISPDGKIVVEGVGPLHLAGKSVQEANKYLADKLGKIYAESSVSLSVGTTRSIVVQVLGEVVTPGSYTLSALSTAFNALYAAGGISSIGTLRSINVYRKGKNIATIDVYDYILNGNTESNVYLQDDDVISVGAYESIVSINGKVKRPMGYELKENETLSSLLKYAGGFMGDAYNEKMRVVRKTDREYSLFTIGKKDMDTFAMCDGDSVFVDSIIPRFSNMVEISGAVFYPGMYQFGEEINTVSKLIEAAGGLCEDAFLNRAVLIHRNPNKINESESVDLNGIVNGTTADVMLRNNDELIIISSSEMKGELYIRVNGEVREPGKYEFAENLTVEDMILRAGGLTHAASTARVDVSRQIYDPLALVDVEEKVETFSFEIKNGFIVDGEENFVLQPFDEINVRRSPVYGGIANVEITGEVNFAGKYPVTSNNFKLSDLVKVAGGASNKAYLKGATLYRKATKEEIEQSKTLKKYSNILMYEDVLQASGNVNLALLDSLMLMKLSEEKFYKLAIDLEKAVGKPGCEHDVMLRDGDILTIPEYTSTVKIRGEVNYPTAVNWEKGKSLKDYLKHAGGFSTKAKRNGVYIIKMNGAVEKISRNSKKAIVPGSEIVVPSKRIRKRMTTGEVVAIGTSAVSLSTMIVTLVRMLY